MFDFLTAPPPWWAYAVPAVVVALAALWAVHKLFARAAERKRAARTADGSEQGPGVTWGHRLATAAILTGALVLAGAAFAMSAATLMEQATWLADTPFGDIRWMFPLALDALILWTLALDLVMEWQGQRAPLARWAAIGLSVLTIVLNVAGGHADGGATSYLGHAGPPIAVILISECVSLWIRHLAGLARGAVADRIPFGRWVAHPISTAKVARRMLGRGITDYPTALAIEGRRQLAYAMLRTQHGRAWRRATPRHIRWMLDHGDDATVQRGLDLVTAMTPLVATTPDAARALADPADTIRTLPLLTLPGHTPTTAVPAAATVPAPRPAGGHTPATRTAKTRTRPTATGRTAPDTDERVATVAAMLAEDPTTDGAAVAKRLGVSPRTGRRLLKTAKDTATASRHLTAV